MRELLTRQFINPAHGYFESLSLCVRIDVL